MLVHIIVAVAVPLITVAFPIIVFAFVFAPTRTISTIEVNR